MIQSDYKYKNVYLQKRNHIYLLNCLYSSEKSSILVLLIRRLAALLNVVFAYKRSVIVVYVYLNSWLY